MTDVTQDIHSMTTFKRNSSGLMKLMKKTGRPFVLTVNGKAEAVVIDATAYREVGNDWTPSPASGAAWRRRRRGWGGQSMKCSTIWNARREVSRHYHAGSGRRSPEGDTRQSSPAYASCARGSFV
jgi:prevent-host-death family protein